MINVFWMIYHQGKAHWDNKWHMAGELAVRALNCPRELVSELETLYREDNEARLVELLGDMDCITPITGSVEYGSAKELVDDLICFRVYIRYFLTRYCARQSDSDALSNFLHNLDALSTQLRREDNLRRTVLSTEIKTEMGYRVVGGEVCECISFGSLREVLIYDVMRALEYGLPPRCCPSCGRYFVPERSNVVYCDGIAPQEGDAEPKTCREVGARRTFEKRSSASEEIKVYSAACGRIYTRKSRGKLSQEEAAKLLEQCAKLRDRALAGEMSAVELEDELFALTGGRRKARAKPDSEE